MLSAARGYRLVICLPRNASVERQRLLKAYGARIEYTSPLEGSDGAIRRARELAALNTDWIYLDQYGNEANWQAHFRGTGPEIWRQTAGSITHFVSCLGTSGTMMGVGRYLRSLKPSPDYNLHIIVVKSTPADSMVQRMWTVQAMRFK